MSTTIFPRKEDLSLHNIMYPGTLDASSEQDFSHLAELAAFSCNCPHAVISLAGVQKQWVNKQKYPFSNQLPVQDIFNPSSYRDEVLVITDVINDDRFNATAASGNYKRILFYAGAPIISPEGRLLGSLVVMDSAPRSNFTKDQKRALKSIAQLAVRLLKLKVANSVIAKEAEGMVEAEKKMNCLILSEQETEKVFIAHKLQENFAQTLAATKLYLEYAGQSKGEKNQFIQKSVESISGVIDEIKYLCKTMVPSTLGNTNPVELLEDMVIEWETRHNISIDFTCGTSLKGIDTQTGLSLFRIIQQQLKLVSCCDALKAEISILEKNGVALYFTMKDIDFTGGNPQKELFINSINTWVAMSNGKMTIDRTLSDNEVMQISIPVVVGEA